MENHQDSSNKRTFDDVMANAGEETNGDIGAESTVIQSAGKTASHRGLRLFFMDIRHIFKLDDLGREVVRIALPAALALAADPLASLVDTAFVGRLGSVELAAVGVSIAIFNQVSKVAIYPLVSVTTSFVAEEEALICDSPEEKGITDMEKGSEKTCEMKESDPGQDSEFVKPGCKRSSCSWPDSGHGCEKVSTMQHGKKCLPSVSTALIVGAVLGILQTILLITTGFLLLARVIAATICVTMAASLAAHHGTIPMAAFQICLQVWLATSLLADGLAVAGQAILASAFAKGELQKVMAATSRVLQLSVVLGLVLTVLLGLGLQFGTGIFTKDINVKKQVHKVIPFVAGTQTINSLAFVFDGVNFGASDYSFSAYSMVIVAAVSIPSLIFLSGSYGFIGIWTALTIYMTLRTFASVWRYFLQSHSNKQVHLFKKLDHQ